MNSEDYCDAFIDATLIKIENSLSLLLTYSQCWQRCSLDFFANVAVIFNFFFFCKMRHIFIFGPIFVIPSCKVEVMKKRPAKFTLQTTQGIFL